MGIFNLFTKSQRELKRHYIDVNELCEEDKIKLENRLELVRATLDKNGKQIYIVKGHYTAVSNLLYNSECTMRELQNNLVYLDNTPVLDSYGVMREAEVLGDTVRIAKDLQVDADKNDARRMVKILAKYRMYNTSTCAKIRLLIVDKNTQSNRYQMQLSDGRVVQICLDDNIFEVKRYSGRHTIYKAVNNTGRDINVMMYGGVRGGGNEEHIWPDKVSDGQVFLVDEKSLIDLEHDDVGNKAFEAAVYRNMRVKLNTEGVNSARDYMASNDRYKDTDNIKEKYSNGRIYTGLGRELIASRPFNIKDKELMKRDLFRDLYISIMRQIVPNYNDEYDTTYKLTHKLVNNKNETLGYRVTKISDLYGQYNGIDIALNDVFSLVNKGKVTNATIVLSDNKKPYIRCDKELPKIEITL